jgi:uncharacterized protein DUF4287/uncharacterized protein DUF5655
MSFQAYIDNIKAKTGKTPDDFKKLAEQKGLLKEGVKTGQIVAWLKEDFDLGHGHAMAIVLTLKPESEKKVSKDDKVGKHFSGKKSAWRKPYDDLMKTLNGFGPDVSVAPTNTYISLLRGKSKFGMIAITADRMDIGIKLKGVSPVGRLEKAGEWNSMVTHRVRIDDPKQIDREIMDLLKQAYQSA